MTVLKVNHILSSKDAAQTVQGCCKGLVLHIAVRIRPQCICQIIFSDTSAAKGDQDLQQGKWFLLGFTTRPDRLSVFDNFKAAKGVNLYGPWPFFNVNGGRCRNDTLSAYEVSDIFGFNVEQSLLLNPLRGQTEFEDWLNRYRARRDAMLQNMIEMENRGEIIAAATVKRMSAL